MLLVVKCESIRSVVFPPTIIVVLAKIKCDSKYIGECEPIVEALALATNVFIKLFGILPFNLVVASRVNNRDLTFCYIVGNCIGKLNIILILDHSRSIAKDNKEIKIFYGKCRIHNALACVVSVSYRVINKSVRGIYGAEAVALANLLALKTAKGTSVYHRLCVN